MIQRIKQNQKWITFLTLVLMVLVSVGYAYKIGLLFCGYFFADDHEIARLHGGIVRDGLFRTMALWIEADTNLRFRPIYWVFRVFESYVCGTHVILWHFIKACEIGFCAWVSFVFARKMKASYVVAVIFGVVGFFGTQCAVVYRLGPQEPMALIWLFLGLICACMYVGDRVKPVEEKGKRRWIIGFHFFMTMMMLTKESFLLLVPICVFFLLFYDMQHIDAGEERIVSLTGKVLKKHLWSILYEAVVCVICMGVIVLHSGVSSTGYAGFDPSYGARDYIAGIWNVWRGELKLYLFLLLVTVLVNVILCVIHRQEKWFLFFRGSELLFVLWFLFSQSLLHAKTGMSERYLFPCITGILIYVCCFSLPLWGRLWNRKKIIPQLMFAGWALWIVCISQFHALCLNYVFTCSYNTQMLIRLSELAQEKGGEECKVIVSTQFGEWNLALCAFMEELYGVKHTYALSQSDPDNEIAVDRYDLEHEVQETLTIPEADIYVAQREFLPFKMRDCGVDYTQMHQEVFGNYIVYVKE